MLFLTGDQLDRPLCSSVATTGCLSSDCNRIEWSISLILIVDTGSVGVNTDGVPTTEGAHGLSFCENISCIKDKEALNNGSEEVLKI